MFYKKELLAIPIAEPKIKKGGIYFHCQKIDYHKGELLVITVYKGVEAVQRIFIEGEAWINYFFKKEKWNRNTSSESFGLYGENSFDIWDNSNYTDGNSLAVLDEFFKDKRTLKGYLEKLWYMQIEQHRKKRLKIASDLADKSTKIEKRIGGFKFPHSLEKEKIKEEYFRASFFKWSTESGNEGYCTKCKRIFNNFDLVEVVTCPHCGVKGWPKTIRKTREVTTNTSITKFFKNKGVIYAVVYRVERAYAFIKSGRLLKEGFVVRESLRSFPREIYIFDKGKTTTAVSWYSHIYMRGDKYWFEGGEWEIKQGFTEYANPNYIFSPSQKLLKGTLFEHSHFEEICRITKVSLLKYFHTFMKYPNIENLVTNRFDNIVRDIIYNKIAKGSLNLKKARLGEMLGTNREEQKRAIAEEWDTEKLLVYKAYKKQGRVLNEEVLKDICELYSVARGKLDILNDYRLGFYLLKQKKKDNVNVVNYYKDYLSMAGEMGYELSVESILYPPYLSAAHDSLLRKIKYKPDSKRNKTYTEIKKALQEFEVSNNGLCLRVPNDDYDLFLEGRILDHCVGDKEFLEGHTRGRCVFFIRLAENDSVPYYTLNWNVKTGVQLQLHGYKNDRNKAIPREVFEFIAWWKKNVFRRFDVETMTFIDKPKKVKKQRQAAA